MATASTKAMAMALTSLRPAPVSFAREGRDEPHINAIPKRAPARQKPKNPGGRRRFAPSSPGASIGHGPSQRVIAGHCCSAATGGEGRSDRRLDFSNHAGSLLKRKFRVAILSTL